LTRVARFLARPVTVARRSRSWAAAVTPAAAGALLR